MKNITGYIEYSEEAWNFLKGLGFETKIAETPSSTDKFIIIEDKRLWLVDCIKSTGRFANKQLNILDIIRGVNSSINWSESYCKASLGTLCFLLSNGFKFGKGFSEHTKYFWFGSDNCVNGAEACALVLKKLNYTKLIDGEFVNCGKPKISLEKTIAVMKADYGLTKRDIGDYSK